jgi:DnaJ-class molecular chaperone
MSTYYDKLDVTRHASSSDIERSYRHSLNEHIAGNRSRQLRKKDQLRLQQIRQAYLTLASPSRRREYDLRIDQMEHARLRKIERIGTVIGLTMLFAGLTLIAHSYYHQRFDDKPAVHALERGHDAAGGGRKNITLASKAQPAMAEIAQAD